MSAKNDHSEPRPVPPAPDETPKNGKAKSSAKAPAKASARTKTSANAAASEATDTAAPKPRRKAAIATSTEPSVAKAAPRVRRSTRTTGVAATAPVTTDSTIDADEASAVSDSRDMIAFVEDEVRVRAYMLSLARGDHPGSPDADWYQAEREVASSRQL
ncbi:MAG TPA: DUF2934 domain-containing protein [Gemmatimonadaceae bacterium]|nr:DUF2934 domain-containing protein [Gemmatimonadaceae bacterium]